MEKIYKIKNSLRIPMAISIILSLPVFFDIFKRGVPGQHIILAGILIVIFFVFVANTLLRTIRLDDEYIIIMSISGKKIIPLNEVTTADGISLGRRQYISLSYKSRTYLIPNSFQNFTKIIATLTEKLPEDKLCQGLRDIEKFPLVRTGDTISAWITVSILAAIIFLRFFSSVTF